MFGLDAEPGVPDISSSAFFRDFSEEEIAEVSRVCTTHTFEPTEIILHENENSYHFFVILAGRVRIEKALYAGDEKELDILGPGEFFGEMSFLDGSPRSATVRCIDNVVALKIDRKAFDQLEANHPTTTSKMGLIMARALADRLRTSNNLIESIFSNPNKTILELKTRLLKIQTMLLRR